uniref:Secreted protein n=1 Tax=Octopus bimaculoides TaxID=37653 RepID=A0A0L8FUE0_OCTBM
MTCFCFFLGVYSSVCHLQETTASQHRFLPILRNMQQQLCVTGGRSDKSWCFRMLLSSNHFFVKPSISPKYLQKK